jgi:hypothetical protein
MTNEEYLELKIDANTTVKDAGGMQFISFLLKKIDGQNAFDSRVATISGLAHSFPSKTMPDEDKIRYLKMLEELNIDL